MNEEKNSGTALNRQNWEPAGVVSVTNETKGMNYGVKTKDPRKEGQLTLEVEEVFHNQGVMENLPENTSKDKLH